MGGSVHERDFSRAVFGRQRAESAGVAEGVQHGAARLRLHEGRKRGAVQALIVEPARFLTAAQSDGIAHAVFFHKNFVGRGAQGDALKAFEASRSREATIVVEQNGGGVKQLVEHATSSSVCASMPAVVIWQTR